MIFVGLFGAVFQGTEMSSHFCQAKVVLAERNAKFREEIEDVLRDMGFYFIEATGNLSTAEKEIKENSISLFIADTSLPEGDVNDTVRRIRLSKLGGNPFVVCITMVTDPSEEKNNAVMNSGTDDIAIKPFNASQIRERIKMLAAYRPSFVVTSSYIGPSRRDTDRDLESDNLFTVPNPLMSSISLKNYNATINIIQEHRVVRDGQKIKEIINNTVSGIDEGMSADDLKKAMEWLNQTAKDLDVRLKDSVNKPIRAMIMTLRDLAAKISENGYADKDDQYFLKQLGLNISTPFGKERLKKVIEENTSESEEDSVSEVVFGETPKVING